MTDSLYPDVVLLLPFAGANNGTTFVDRSRSPLTVTAVGHAKTVTAESKHYGASCYLDGSGDYFTVNSLCALLVGVSAFTIEGWFRRDAEITGQETLFGFHSSSGANRAVFTEAQYFGSTGSTTSYTAAPIATWFHFAAVRSSARWKAYADGALVLDIAAAANDILPSDLFSIGQEYDSGPTATDFWKGHLQDFRVTLGERYTGPFTPPAALCGRLSNAQAETGILDASGNPAARTVLLLPHASQRISQQITAGQDGRWLSDWHPKVPHRVIFTGEPDRNDLIVAGVIPV